MKLLMFTKHLQELPLDEMVEVVKGLGFQGLDLTVRPGGSVLPERAKAELPGIAKAASKGGLEIGMFSTGITAAEEPHAEGIFRAASELGVRFLKLGYFRYEGFGSAARQFEAVRGRLTGIAALARRYGVTACVHTHSGDFIPPGGGLLYVLLRDFDPAEIGAYVDPGHMTVEGGFSGWKMALDLLSPQIKLVAIKDFQWFEASDPRLGKKAWAAKLVPLTEGIVRWPEVFSCFRSAGYDGYVSVHSEYQGAHSWRDLTVRELIDQTRVDLDYLRKVIKTAAS